MIKKVIHLADIHIRNIKRHEEYKVQFEKLIEQCKEVSSEYDFEEVRIVLAGDLLHSKITTSNEQTILLTWLLKELSAIAPVLILAGNHDYLESNCERLDSITPIIKILDLKNVKYLDMEFDYKSGCYVDDNIVWCLYSIFEGYKIPDVKLEKINHPDKTLIGLFHGALVGSKTATFEFEHGVSLDIFDGVDAVMCGDIHLRQELYYKEIKVVYSGSLVQQDRGESVSSHGFLLWDVESLEYEPVDIESDYGFYKFRINSIEDLENGTEEFVNF